MVKESLGKKIILTQTAKRLCSQECSVYTSRSNMIFRFLFNIFLLPKILPENKKQRNYVVY